MNLKLILYKNYEGIKKFDPKYNIFNRSDFSIGIFS